MCVYIYIDSYSVVCVRTTAIKCQISEIESEKKKKQQKKRTNDTKS